MQQILDQGSASKLTDKLKGPPVGGPRLTQRGRKGGKRSYVQANITEIERSYKTIAVREKRIAAAETAYDQATAKLDALVAKSCEQHAQLGTVPEYLLTRVSTAKDRRDAARLRLDNARKWRAHTMSRVRLMLDYALSHTPYSFTACKECEGKGCKGCKGSGKVKKKDTNPYSQAAADRLHVLDRELKTAEAAYKVRTRAPGYEQAFDELLKLGAPVIAKWSNPSKTGQEPDDAYQNAYRGLLAAADHFDPSRPHAYYCPRCGYSLTITDDLKAKGIKRKDYFDESVIERSRPCPECSLPKLMVVGSSASFKTVAFNWAYRYTRVRKSGQARPGAVLVPDGKRKGKFKLVSTVSIDDPKKAGQDEDGGGLSDQITTAGTLEVVSSNDAIVEDVRNQIAALTDPLQRAVMELQLQNYSLAEMGEKLGVNPKIVSKIRNQAFGVLKTKLADYDGA